MTPWKRGLEASEEQRMAGLEVEDSRPYKSRGNHALEERTGGLGRAEDGRS